MDVARGPVRLSMPVGVAGRVSEIRLETAHSERLLRAAAYRAIQDGRLGPRAPVWGRLTTGVVRARHGSVDCLETCRVELLDGAGAVLATVEFARAVFAAMAVARAVHMVDRDGASDGALPPVTYSLHAVAADEAPFPVAVPPLEELSIEALAARSRREGPADAGDWITTFITAALADGLARIAARSRASGVETAGHIHTRVGFDPQARRFLRILDRVVISERAEATANTVLSTAASWGEFLAGVERGSPRAPSTVHTHLHLARGGGAAAGSGDSHDEPVPAQEEALSPEHGPIISNEDLMTHYDSYPDSLSAALIVSLFPRGSVVKRYGYTRDGVLAEEGGCFVLDAEAVPPGSLGGGEAWR